ncbi:UDP-N-acetylmuramoyl-tripeptide--D-alanyl-D-alanine ligase [Candidatus Babeliales bacterium]|nr:UDP-N-acetylmuramoyl-tripeptide--D-alanyl-D-alanine ligase [Candidatus Babeliales bacterium]
MRMMGDFLKAVLKDVEFGVGPTDGDGQSSFCLCKKCSFIKVKIDSDSGFKTEFCIDSRIVTKGQIYCAIPGACVDGHDFLIEAIKNGAVGLLLHFSHREKLKAISPFLLHGKLIIFVESTTDALIKLAYAWRSTFTCPIVGVTGSLGKTTTKEMLRGILNQGGKKACVSRGNLNTNLGVALSLLAMDSEHKIGVFEVGINDKGKMDEIADLLRPTIGVITCVAHSHLKGLGTQQGVAQEKCRLFKNFGPANIGIINGDQKELDDLYFEYPVIRFGLKTKNQITVRKIKHEAHKTTFNLKIYNEQKRVFINSFHTEILQNVLAASAVAAALELPFDSIVSGIEKFEGVIGRFEQKRVTDGNGIVISDCYNASPESMRAALETIGSMKANHKVAILGDMLELGEKESYWHRQIGRVLCRVRSISHVILVGERAKAIAKTAPITTKTSVASDWKDALDQLKVFLKGKKDSLVLVKASRALRLDRLVKSVTL